MSFANTNNHDIDATVAFPVPTLDGNTIENEPIKLPSKDPTNYMSFHVTVNGQAVAPKVEVRAFKNGKEISARLRALGLPLSVLDPNLRSSAAKLSPDHPKKLVQDEWIVDEGTRNGKSARYLWPWWDTRIQFNWTQHFPANGVIQVHHSYRPVVGGSYIPANSDGKYSVQPYCGDANTLHRMRKFALGKRAKDEGEVIFFERRVQYILTTANNWNGPIRTFHLKAVTDRPEDIFTTCFAGLKHTSQTTYEFTRNDFRPDRELELLILQASG